MHILAAAYACDPEGGSERHVGWTGIRLLAREHRVTVITHGWGKPLIEKVLPTLAERDNLTFVFLGGRHTWSKSRLVGRFQDWQRLRQWTKEAHAVAKELVAKENFDLAHHLTIATWRMPSPLAGLGIPLVFGPVGGGEMFPMQFAKILSPVSLGFEVLRSSANQMSFRSTKLKRFAGQVTIALGNNPETMIALNRIGIPKEKIQYLSQSFLLPEKFLSETDLEQKNKGQVSATLSKRRLKIFAGGNLEGRKGVAIALEALSRFGRKGHAFDFLFGGLGPELKHLQNLAARLNFGAGTVTMGHHLDGSEYRNALKSADIYLLPSLREGAPITMIEAMASGAVPIVANAGGAPMVVDDTCGFVIQVTSPGEMVEKITTALERVAGDRVLLARLSKTAWHRAKDRCMEDAYSQGMAQAYQLALETGV